MEFFRLENAQGIFLPNDKAAEKSGGLLVHRWSFVVSRFGCQMLTHLPLNIVGASRRPALPGLRFLYVPRNPPGGFPPAARD